MTLVFITLLGATVNGALGYGFSSIVVPLALMFFSNRVLNPALVLIEVVLNGYVLFVNRSSIPLVWKRVMPIIVGLVPGVLLGTVLLSRVSPAWMKLSTFAVLVPLILLQAAGFRRPIRSERQAGLLFGGGLGVLYSITTISGPPLAVALSNQGFAKREFRAALGLVRLAEATFTAIAYYSTGLIAAPSLRLIPLIAPSVLLGVPLGALVVRSIRVETFRRICMSFDAWIVAFGCSALLRELRLVEGPASYGVLIAVGATDVWLLYRFFSAKDEPAALGTVRPAVLNQPAS